MHDVRMFGQQSNFMHVDSLQKHLRRLLATNLYYQFRTVCQRKKLLEILRR